MWVGGDVCFPWSHPPPRLLTHSTTEHTDRHIGIYRRARKSLSGWWRAVVCCTAPMMRRGRQVLCTQLNIDDVWLCRCRLSNSYKIANEHHHNYCAAIRINVMQYKLQIRVYQTNVSYIVIWINKITYTYFVLMYSVVVYHFYTTYSIPYIIILNYICIMYNT